MVKESRKGIKSDHLESYNLIRDSARYVETSLKYLLTLNTETKPISNDDVANLCVLGRAHILHLEDKYAAIRVRSSNGKKAGDLFETQVAGTSGLAPRHLEVWQTTAQIAAAGGFSNREDRGRDRGRGFRRGTGRRGGNFYRRGEIGARPQEHEDREDV